MTDLENHKESAEHKTVRPHQKRMLSSLRPMHERRYIARKYIWASDGWLAPDGTFWACSGEEHDRCAQHVLSTEHITLEEGEHARLALRNAGFVQLSGGIIMTGTKPISPEQMARLSAVEVDIPQYSSDKDLLLFFDKVEQGLLWDETGLRFLFQQFVENNFKLHAVNDDLGLLTLFDYFCEHGFTFIDRITVGARQLESYTYAMSWASNVVVRLREHQHVDRNLQGLFHECYLEVITADAMVKELGYDPYVEAYPELEHSE